MAEATTDLTQCLTCDWHIENDKLREQIENLKAIKCPPISESDSCICPIEELEERIALAIGGIDALTGFWGEGQAKKDILAIKQTLEPKLHT